MCEITGADPVLQFLDDRTCGIDDFDAPLARDPVSGRRFAVGAKEDTRVGRERSQVVIIDSCEAFEFESSNLLTIVNDVA